MSYPMRHQLAVRIVIWERASKSSTSLSSANAPRNAMHTATIMTTYVSSLLTRSERDSRRNCWRYKSSAALDINCVRRICAKKR